MTTHCRAIVFFLDTKNKVTTLFSSSFVETQRRRQQQLILLKHRKDKTHEKPTKKKSREGRELLFKLLFCPLIFGSHFCPLGFALLFQVLSPDIFFFLSKIKKTQRKKKPLRRKICKGGRELTFKLPFYPLTFGSCFCLPTFTFMFQVFSFSIFFFSSKTQRKKNHRK